jgi:hypothetical protein
MKNENQGKENQGKEKEKAGKLKREKDLSERRNEASGEGIILLSLISKSERSKFGAQAIKALLKSTSKKLIFLLE